MELIQGVIAGGSRAATREAVALLKDSLDRKDDMGLGMTNYFPPAVLRADGARAKPRTPRQGGRGRRGPCADPEGEPALRPRPRRCSRVSAARSPPRRPAAACRAARPEAPPDAVNAPRPPARDLETFALKKKVLRLETLYDVQPIAHGRVRRAGSPRRDPRARRARPRRGPRLRRGLRGRRGRGRRRLRRARARADAARRRVRALRPRSRAREGAARPGGGDRPRPSRGQRRGRAARLGGPGRSASSSCSNARRAADVDAAFDEEDRRFLGSLAALAAPALEGSRRFRALAADLDRLREENRSLKGTQGVDELLIGDSPAMRRVEGARRARRGVARERARSRARAAPARSSSRALLHTGSPAARRAVPRAQLRARCPRASLESELFGHEKGVARASTARRGQVRARERRHAVPRRDRRHRRSRCRPSSCASCRSARSSASAGARRVPVDVRVVAATQPRPRDAESARGASARTSSTGCSVVEIAMPAAARAPRGHPAPRGALPRADRRARRARAR